MIRLYPIGVFQIEPGETPESIRQSLQNCWGINFTSHIQETKTGRVLPPDEKLVDGFEYFINFDQTPNFPLIP
jgi:hypothetical protein